MKSGKRKRSQFLEKDDSSSSTLAAEEDVEKNVGPFSLLNYNNDDSSDNDWEEEQDYERQRRSLGKKKTSETSRLPIKTADGRIVQPPPTPRIEKTNKDKENNAESEFEGFGGEEELVELELNTTEKAPRKSEKERILEAKEELSKLASTLIEEPEENVGQLHRLKEIYEGDTSETIKKFVLGTQLAVYKDIIPGYRIRPLTLEEQKIKVTKDVKKLRNFEQGLVFNYKAYVEALGKLARNRKDGPSPLANIAITCACTLLNAVPHFNFRTELLKIVIEKMSIRSVDESLIKCRDAIQTLFVNDDSGSSSLDAVKMITRMIKAKKYLVHESVVNTFLSLRLLSELDTKASHEGTDRRKLKKKDREPWTKKRRREEKEKKALVAEMKEADAVVHHEERERMQSETLKLVFVCYFHILKEKSSPLMAATLEGLAIFAHLINIDFFDDILKALKEIIVDLEEQEDDRNAARKTLLAIVTSFSLLFGQGGDAHKTMNLDLTFFINHLYITINTLSLSSSLEESSKSLHLPDPLKEQNSITLGRDKNVNVATEIEMLIRSLDFVFFKSARSLGGLSATRIAAFTKRLYIAALQMPEKSAVATLKILEKLVKAHSQKVLPLLSSEDRIGDGQYNAYAEEAEMSNPFAGSIVYENVLLQKHYSPKVADTAKEALRGMRKKQ